MASYISAVNKTFRLGGPLVLLVVLLLLGEMDVHLEEGRDNIGPVLLVELAMTQAGFEKSHKVIRMVDKRGECSARPRHLVRRHWRRQLLLHIRTLDAPGQCLAGCSVLALRSWR